MFSVQINTDIFESRLCHLEDVQVGEKNFFMANFQDNFQKNGGLPQSTDR